MLGLMDALRDPYWPTDFFQERVEQATLRLHIALLVQAPLVEGWLASLPPEADAGQRAQPEACPLHTYLCAVAPSLPCDGMGIYSTYMTARAPRPIGEWRPSVEMNLPAWAERLVAAVDASGHFSISAGETLELLHIVLKGDSDDDL